MNGGGRKLGRFVRTAMGAAGAAALPAAGTPTAFAGASGCNDRTCIRVDGSGLRGSPLLIRAATVDH